MYANDHQVSSFAQFFGKYLIGQFVSLQVFYQFLETYFMLLLLSRDLWPHSFAFQLRLGVSPCSNRHGSRFQILKVLRISFG